MAHLVGVKIANQLARGGRVVQVNHADRHLHGLAFVHQGCKKDDDQDGEYHHAESIDGIM